MKFSGRVALDDGMTLGTVRQVTEILNGIGTVTMRNDLHLFFEVEADDDETAFDFGVRIASLGEELRAYGVDLDPRERVEPPPPPKPATVEKLKRGKAA